MPKTDADWETLDERLAREVRGWCKWGDLPEAARRAYWEIIAEEPDEYWLAHNEQQWWSLDESGCPDTEEWCDEWQPHKNVEQALKILDAIVAQGFDADVKTRRYDSQHEVWITPAECRGPCWLGVHEERAKAICLAAEQWANAQKEEQDDPG